MIEQEIVKITTNHLGPDCLILAFGSVARGATDKLSDIDLAFYRKRPITESEIINLKEDLDHQVHTLRFFDLINLTSPVLHRPLVENILKEGVLWHKPKNSNELLKNLTARLKNTKKSSKTKNF